MSEFECAECHDLMGRDGEGKLRCDSCGCTRIVRMDGMTAREHEAMDREFEEEEERKRYD